MPNYRLSIDLIDLQLDLLQYDLREYRLPFCLYFIEAENPDDACSIMMNRIMLAIMKIKPTIETRIICRKIRRHMRIDKIECL
tara:strand:- start:1109 stop:1357 length:249 start_codon:yes stop_codon:yes gene_type:complete